jgi:thiosulfate reductase/polysulfide reductase chain A
MTVSEYVREMQSFLTEMLKKERTMKDSIRSDLAQVYRFLSTVLRDEVQPEVLDDLSSRDFRSPLQAMAPASPLAAPALALSDESRDFDAAQLRYEYADLFLNAGANPVFPYESVHRTGTPVVQQQPLFDLREAMRVREVQVNPDFRDLDEHIAVELDLCAHLLETGGDYEAFFTQTLHPWAPLFCGQLESCAAHPWYVALGRLAAAILECAHSLIGDSGADCAGEFAALAGALRASGFSASPSLILPGARPAGPEREIPTHCYTCGALCGMKAKVKDGVMTGAAGLPGDPKGAGRLCPKGGSTPKHVNSAYRLKAPLIRENGRFRKASWDEALDLVAAGMSAVPEGRLAYFRGNDFANFVHEAFFEHLGCPKGTHRTMCDNSNRMANEHNLSDKRPWINYDESDYIILFGNNELATSYGQRKTAAFKKALDRGAKLVVFDPRKSETAAKATEWLPVIPGTDGAAAMAMAYVIITEELYDAEFVANWTTGFAEFRARVTGEEDGTARTPEWAEAICGIPAETLARIAREFAAAKAKGALSWTGLAQTPNAHWATAAIQSLNGLCGTFDAPGGPSLPFKRKLGSAWRDGRKKPEKKAAPKMDNYLLWAGWSPAKFAEQVEDGRIRALFSYWADPVLTWGNSESVARGLEKLDFCVTVDAFMCNTALYSDVVLPDATWLEQAQVKPDWLYEAFLSYFAEVVPPMYDSRPMYRIVQGLAERMGVADAVPWSSMEEAFANQMRDLPWSFDELREKGFIVTDEARYRKYREWGSINPPAGYGSSGASKTGKYNFLNPVSLEKGVDPLPDFKPVEEGLRPDADYPFLFGNIRILQHEHCSTFNNFQLMKLRKTNTMLMNTADAERHGIASGDLVQVSSPWGAVRIKVDVTDDIRPGVLAAPGGYGHVRGLEGDPKYPDMGGVNVPGALMPPNTTEPTGGTPLLKYIKAKVEKAT